MPGEAWRNAFFDAARASGVTPSASSAATTSHFFPDLALNKRKTTNSNRTPAQQNAAAAATRRMLQSSPPSSSPVTRMPAAGPSLINHHRNARQQVSQESVSSAVGGTTSNPIHTRTNTCSGGTTSDEVSIPLGCAYIGVYDCGVGQQTLLVRDDSLRFYSKVPNLGTTMLTINFDDVDGILVTKAPPDAVVLRLHCRRVQAGDDKGTFVDDYIEESLYSSFSIDGTPVKYVHLHIHRASLRAVLKHPRFKQADMSGSFTTSETAQAKTEADRVRRRGSLGSRQVAAAVDHPTSSSTMTRRRRRSEPAPTLYPPTASRQQPARTASSMAAQVVEDLGSSSDCEMLGSVGHAELGPRALRSSRRSLGFEPRRDLFTITEKQCPNKTRKRLVYPTLGAKDSVTLTNEELHRLEHMEFLNDTIIDFYLKYLQDEIRKKPGGEDCLRRCHFFNSFFYKRLRQTMGNPSKRKAKTPEQLRAGYDSIRRWTKSTDIFEKDFIFVPINENLHWTLAIIVRPGLVARSAAAAQLADGASVSPGAAEADSEGAAYNSAAAAIASGAEGSTSPLAQAHALAPPLTTKVEARVDGPEGVDAAWAAASHRCGGDAVVGEDSLGDGSNDEVGPVDNSDHGSLEGDSPPSYEGQPSVYGGEPVLGADIVCEPSLADVPMVADHAGLAFLNSSEECTQSAVRFDGGGGGHSVDPASPQLVDDDVVEVIPRRKLRKLSQRPLASSNSVTPMNSVGTDGEVADVPCASPAAAPRHNPRRQSVTDFRAIIEQTEYQRKAQEEHLLDDFELETEADSGEPALSGAPTAREPVVVSLDSSVSLDVDDAIAATTLPQRRSARSGLRSNSSAGATASTALCMDEEEKPRPRRRPVAALPSQPVPMHFGPRACILFFDSLGGKHNAAALSLIKAYLEEEWRDKKGSSAAAGADAPTAEAASSAMRAASATARSRGRFSSLQPVNVKVPQQRNHCDCGLFMLKYVERFAEFGLSLDPPLENCTEPRWNLWEPLKFDTTLIDLMRGEIFRLIMHLSSEQEVELAKSEAEAAEAAMGEAVAAKSEGDDATVSADGAPRGVVPASEVSEAAETAKGEADGETASADGASMDVMPSSTDGSEAAESATM